MAGWCELLEKVLRWREGGIQVALVCEGVEAWTGTSFFDWAADVLVGMVC